MTERLEFDGGCSWGLGRDYSRRWHHETRQRGGRLGPQAGVLSLVPGLFSTDVEESTRSLRSLLRMCVAQEPATEDPYLTLGYNVSVPLLVRQALLSRSFDNDDLLPTLQKPVPIVHGDRDPIVNPSVVDQHKASLLDAEVAMMPNAVHAPFWDDAPAFNERLQTFCERLEP